MLHYFIKIVDNCFAGVVIAALLLVIILLKNRHKLIVGCALGLGFAAALIYAILKRNTGFAVREFYDLGVILPLLAALLLVCLLSWPAKKFYKNSELKPPKMLCAILSWALTLALAGLAAYVLPNIMLYPFEFAVGMDSIFNQDYLFKVVGYALGLLFMLLLGLSIYKIATEMPLLPLLSVIAASLLVFMLGQALEVSQILLTRGFIPRYGWLLNMVLSMLEHANWFIYGLAIILGLAGAAQWLRLKLSPMASGNPAEIRKQKAAERKQKRYCWLLFLLLLVTLLAITVGRYYENRGVELSPPMELPAVNGQIVIPLPTVNDGHLHRYVYKAENGTEIRYIVIRKSESGYGVGLDACDICGPTGYYERNGKEVVCILCDVVMNISTIGFPGGCNPVPLKFMISEGSLVIKTQDLENERRRFE